MMPYDPYTTHDEVRFVRGLGRWARPSRVIAPRERARWLRRYLDIAQRRDECGLIDRTTVLAEAIALITMLERGESVSWPTDDEARYRYVPDIAGSDTA